MFQNFSFFVFIDGSSLGNPGPGGWGALLIAREENQIAEIGGSKKNSTNNEMELEALVQSLSFLRGNSGNILFFSDSRYLVQAMSIWLDGWRKNGWRRKDGKEIKNLSLWKKISSLLEERGKNTVFFIHIPSHVGIFGNERVDKIAQSFAKGESIELYQGTFKKYPFRDKLLLPSLEEIYTKKSQKRRRKDKQKCYYLSFQNGKVTRYENWEECKKHVLGKKGIRYKKICSKEEREDFLKSF